MNMLTEEPRPIIETVNRQLRDVIDDAWSAIRSANRPPTLYRYYDKLVYLHERPDGRRVEFVDGSSLHHHLEHVASWVRTTRRWRTSVRVPRILVRLMLYRVDEQLPHLDTELLPVRDTLGWLAFDAGAWTSFVLAWWERFQDEAVTAARLVELCAARGLLSPVVASDRPGGAAVRLGRAVLAVRRRRRLHGGHMIIGPVVRNGRSYYRLTCRLRESLHGSNHH